MSHVSIEGVQKLLHLEVSYPYFPTYEENLEFVVDKVTVKAIAKVRWRWISIDIIEPFSIRAWTFDPPFIALGISMAHRQQVLLTKGMTSREDFIQKTRDAYVRHVTYLRLKPLIDIAQEDFLAVFRQELQSLEATNLDVQARVAHEKSVLRKMMKFDQMCHKNYQNSLKRLKEESWDAWLPFSELRRQVEVELAEIKDSLIDEALSNEAAHRPV